MKKIVLVGEKEAKRTNFFLSAAKDIGETVYFMDIHKKYRKKNWKIVWLKLILW